MSSHQPLEPFRFLDLPAEIRNNVYDLLLCSWQDQLDTELGIVSKVGRRCPRYPASSVLRANKQIHAEAFDYMIKRNQFVRVTCRGMNVQQLLLGDSIPVVTTDPREVSNFPGYVMHLQLSKPVFEPSPVAFREYEMLMLRNDLPKLCDNLDIESIMADANTTTDNHASINACVTFPWKHHQILTPKIQTHLLDPVATLRGITNLRFQGSVDPTLAASVSQLVAKPRWTDSEATLSEIHTGVDVGKRQWQQSNFYTAADSWNYALRTLERMRHSSSWLHLKEQGGLEFVNETADLYFTLNLLSAAFLQVDMAETSTPMTLVRRNGGTSLAHLRKCETASARFKQHAGATWSPSNQQVGKMMYRQAKCMRLLHDSEHRQRVVELIQQAVVLAPNDLAIRDEKENVLQWNTNCELEEMTRSVEGEQEALTQENLSLWSRLFSGVTELLA